MKLPLMDEDGMRYKDGMLRDTTLQIHFEVVREKSMYSITRCSFFFMSGSSLVFMRLSKRGRGRGHTWAIQLKIHRDVNASVL